MTVPSPTVAPIKANPRRDFELLVRSRYAVIMVATLEEERAETMIVELASQMQRFTFVWSVTGGLMRAGETATVDERTTNPEFALTHISELTNNAIYVLRDFGPFLNDDKICRRIRDIARSSEKTLVILGHQVDIPPSIAQDSTVFRLPPPDIVQIRTQLLTMLEQLKHRNVTVTTTEDDITQMVNALRGLTTEQIDKVITRCALEDGMVSSADVQRVLQLKSEKLAQSGVIELSDSPRGFEWVAGCNNLKAWVQTRSRAFDPEAQAYGLDPPRGVLLTGVPGCGKSMAVKAMAHDLKMPLLRLDAGSLFDKFVGATEQNLRQAFSVAEALAPSILWIDEIEKAFAASGPSDTDGGLAFRLVGMLATWMQERPAPVFIAATSNNTTILPPELTRQGRFDEIFFVDLPTLEEREHLFRLQLAMRSRDYLRFDCLALANAANGFSGSEIEQSVTNALYCAFAENSDITTEYVAREIAATRPLSFTAPEKIAAIREWGKTRARPV